MHGSIVANMKGDVTDLTKDQNKLADDRKAKADKD